MAYACTQQQAAHHKQQSVLEAWPPRAFSLRAVLLITPAATARVANASALTHLVPCR